MVTTYQVRLCLHIMEAISCYYRLKVLTQNIILTSSDIAYYFQSVIKLKHADIELKITHTHTHTQTP